MITEFTMVYKFASKKVGDSHDSATWRCTTQAIHLHGQLIGLSVCLRQVPQVTQAQPQK